MSSVADFMGFGNPYANAPAVAMPNAGLYNVDTSGINSAMGGISSYLGAGGAANVGVDTSGSQAGMDQQQGLINQLMATANGTAGPSAADLQMQQGLQTSLQQGRNVAQSIAANNPIAALQASSGAQALAARQTVGSAAILRAQESATALNQAGTVEGQQTQEALAQQGQKLTASQDTASNQLSGLNSQLTGATNTAQMTSQANMAYSNALLTQQNTARQQAIASAQAAIDSRRQLFSAILTGGGSIGAAALTGKSGATAPAAAAGSGSDASAGSGDLLSDGMAVAAVA